MRYLALCCDYDGTLAHDGRVHRDTLAGLEKLLASGRRLVMVTGREVPDLQTVFPRLDLFERVVAENGALLWHPAAREETPLAERPPGKFIDLLRRRGLHGLYRPSKSNQAVRSGAQGSKDENTKPPQSFKTLLRMRSRRVRTLQPSGQHISV